MKIKRIIQSLLFLGLQLVALSVTGTSLSIKQLRPIPLLRTDQRIKEGQLITQYWFRQTSPNILQPINQFPLKLSQLIEEHRSVSQEGFAGLMNEKIDAVNLSFLKIKNAIVNLKISRCLTFSDELKLGKIENDRYSWVRLKLLHLDIGDIIDDINDYVRSNVLLEDAYQKIYQKIQRCNELGYKKEIVLCPICNRESSCFCDEDEDPYA